MTQDTREPQDEFRSRLEALWESYSKVTWNLPEFLDESARLHSEAMRELGEKVKEERDEIKSCVPWRAERQSILYDFDQLKEERDRLSSQVSTLREALEYLKTDDPEPLIRHWSHTAPNTGNTRCPRCVIEKALQPPIPEPPIESTKEPRIYTCDRCPALRTLSEGGAVFSVCDVCWDEMHPTSTHMRCESCHLGIPCPAHPPEPPAATIVRCGDEPSSSCDCGCNEAVAEEEPARPRPCEYCGHRKGEWPNREEEK